MTKRSQHQQSEQTKMKQFLILLCTIALANAFTFIRVQRLGRDVSHVNHLIPHNSYLPPPDDAEPSKEYLPPVIEKQAEPEQPTNEYLPPVIEKQAEPEQPTNEYLPPENEISTEAQSPPSNEYLPPIAEVREAEEATETPMPSNEYLPPAKTNGEDYSEVPAEPIAKASEHPEPDGYGEVVEAETEAVQDTAVLQEDGYHYKVPSEIPELPPGILPIPEHMLPLEEGVVEVEGPMNGESATLEEDGYHYRAIKRRF